MVGNIRWTAIYWASPDVQYAAMVEATVRSGHWTLLGPSFLFYSQLFSDSLLRMSCIDQNKNLEMWANAQRDGRPAEHRWRPLFNAAEFG